MSQTDIPVSSHVSIGALRWLNAIDLDPVSRSYGIADRDFWAWKTKDFPNATWQGGLAGFADSYKSLGMGTEQAVSVATAVLSGTLKIQRSSGSFEEAYPLEDSYAVTALVLFCLLYAYYRAPELFDSRAKEQLTKISGPACAFLANSSETHGVIANHLVTGALAMTLAARFLGQDPSLPRERLAEVCALQDEEGWFPEYGGADPGYQTLFNHYLAAALSVGVEADREVLSKSVAFIGHFCFPDGSFAGETGARGTAIFYPSGALELREDGCRVCGAEWFELKHLNSLSCLSPAAADSGNFVPVFNAWALYSALKRDCPPQTQKDAAPSSGTVLFKKAGLLVAWNESGRLVASLNNGSVRKTVLRGGCFEDDSAVAFVLNGYSTQLSRPELLELSPASAKYRLRAAPLKQAASGPWSLAAVRLLGLAGYCWKPFHRVVKRLLAAYVMHREGGGIETGITVAIDLKTLETTVDNPGKWQKRRFGFHKHMASANSFSDRAL